MSQIKAPHFYDMSVFNHCAETGKVLLTIECWQEVHPGLVDTVKKTAAE